MKSIYFTPLVIFSLSVCSQAKYITKVHKANKVYIKDGITYVTVSDTINIGKVIINETIKSDIYITDFTQEKDSSGKYISIINLGNQPRKTFFDLNFTFKCNKPFLSAKWGYSGNGQLITETTSQDKMQFDFTAGQINTFDGIVSIYIISEYPINISIKGVNGYLNSSPM